MNFAPKYLVNDILKAKCDAPIRVEVIDRSTGVPLGEEIPDIHLEVSLETLADVSSVLCKVLQSTVLLKEERNTLCEHSLGRTLQAVMWGVRTIYCFADVYSRRQCI